ncbi:Protein of unknown function [Sphingomonas laterariae]|uniref:DUF2474 domain-containing protein n=1 Tax=Edaphosphingomonas laterariae TaxID=861865 RepID=A0A239GZ06_9SPHN|nr:DUF2474 family protein [Sphingomonas laterariae]SNS74449.1 Protein of unknown function [Sphingomonas laterariae]
MATTERPATIWARRIGWFVAIWVMSVVVIGAVAWLLRLAIKG